MRNIAGRIKVSPFSEDKIHDPKFDDKADHTMNSRLTLAAAVGLLAICQNNPGPALAQRVPNPTQTVQLNDAFYGMTAARLEIPAGWRFAGGVTRDEGCHGNGPSLKFSISSPDGSMGFSQVPGVRWNGPSSPQVERILYQAKCPPINITSASSFLINIAAPNLRPGAVVVAVLPLTPERQQRLEQQQEQMNAQGQQMAARYSQRAPEVKIEGARVRILYKDRNGRQMEGQLQAVVTCTDSFLPGLMNSGRTTTRGCSVGASSIMYAPAGQLDAMLQSTWAMNIPNEAQINPQWEQRIADDSRQAFNRQQAANAAAQKAVLANGDAAGRALQQQHAADMQQSQQRYAQQNSAAQAQQAEYAQHNALEANRQDVVHGQARQVVRYANDRGLFQDPTTGQTIEANSSYNHQWISGDGSTLLQTNDHTYDPNGRTALNTTWTELEPR